MIINEEIRGAWDQPTNTIVMQNVESSHLQTAAVQFADKVNLLMELNERTLRSLRTGGAHEDDEGRRKGHWDEDGGGKKHYSNRTSPSYLTLSHMCDHAGARSGNLRGHAHVRGRGRGRSYGDRHSGNRNNQGGGQIAQGNPSTS